jgi:hypothetical protein
MRQAEQTIKKHGRLPASLEAFIHMAMMRLWLR